MAALLDLIRRVQALNLPAGTPSGLLFDQALDALLLAEGPPVSPIDGFSEGFKTAIARSPRGRPLFLAHSWETGPWVCLRLDLAPVPLGRPIFIRNPQTGYGRIATDYQSQKLQKRIVSACQALRIPAPPEPSRLALNFSGEAILIAWTADESSAPALRGDLDNYTKNIMDGLQRAKMFRNDRHVASFVAARVQLPGPKLTLEEFLSEQLRAAVKESPKASAKSLAPKLGLSVRAVKRLFQHIHEVDTQKAIEKALAATPAAAPIAEQIPAAAGGLDKEGPSPAPAAPSSSSPTELAPTVHPATTKAHAPADQRGRGNARGRRDRSSRTNRRFAGGPVLRTSPILEAGATNFAPISSDESHADAIAGP